MPLRVPINRLRIVGDGSAFNTYVLLDGRIIDNVLSVNILIDPSLPGSHTRATVVFDDVYFGPGDEDDEKAIRGDDITQVPAGSIYRLLDEETVERIRQRLEVIEYNEGDGTRKNPYKKAHTVSGASLREALEVALRG